MADLLPISDILPSRARPGALCLDDILADIEIPKMEVPEPGAFEIPNPVQEDLFAPKKRKAWKEDQADEARCDFATNKIRVSFRNPEFGIISLWKKSIYGRTLTDIKADDDMPQFFAAGMEKLIRQILSNSLSSGDWCIVTAPKRRHKTRNFASLICILLAGRLGIPFYEDLAGCASRQRVGAVFHLERPVPKESNIIVFDDFVTTGSTMIAMRNLLLPHNKNLIFFTGINNKL